MYPFFFHAEDGIRDRDVTGVQTCALPILTQTGQRGPQSPIAPVSDSRSRTLSSAHEPGPRCRPLTRPMMCTSNRSEERRVGKEGRTRRTTQQYKKNKLPHTV